MCGRITLAISRDDLYTFLQEELDIEQFQVDYPLPRYNIAPSQSVLSVLFDGTNNRIGTLKWGFIPPYSKTEQSKYTLVNIKQETLFTKNTFTEAFSKRRCLILGDGFYEWKQKDDKKIPMRIQSEKEKILLFAGLWTTFVRDNGEKVHTCAIITTQSNAFMESIHHRMPVILTKEQSKIWLREKNVFSLQEFLEKPTIALDGYEVGNAVNFVQNDSVECIQKR